MLPGSYITFFKVSERTIGVTASAEDFDSCSGNWTKLPLKSESATIYLPESGVLYFVSETNCSDGVKVRGVIERKHDRFNGVLVLLILLPSVPIFCLGVSIKRLTLLFAEGAFFGTLATATKIGMFLFWRSYVHNFVEILDVDWAFWFRIAFGLYCSSLVVNFSAVLHLIQCSRSSIWIFPCSVATPWFVRLAYSTSMCYDESIAGREGLGMVVITNSAVFYQIAPQLFFQLMYWFQRGFLFRDQEHLGYVSTLGIVSMLSDALCLVILLLQFICPVDWERDDDDVFITKKKPTPRERASTSPSMREDISNYQRNGPVMQAARRTSASSSVELMRREPENLSPSYRNQRLSPRKDPWRKIETRQAGLEQRADHVENPSDGWYSSSHGRKRVRSSPASSTPHRASAQHSRLDASNRRDRVVSPYRSSTGFHSTKKNRIFNENTFENARRSHSNAKPISPVTYYNSYGRGSER